MKSVDERRAAILAAMPVYKDWPKPGVEYLNTVDICRDPVAFRHSVDFFYEIGAVNDVDHIFAADARGFIWASVVASKLGVPLITVRKKGKMPGNLLSREYQLEYGTDILEVRNEPIHGGSAMVIDDVLATGGTAAAICDLVHELGVPHSSITFASLINIESLGGREKLRNLGVSVYSLIDKNP